MLLSCPCPELQRRERMGGGDPLACTNFLCRETTAAVATSMLHGYQHDHIMQRRNVTQRRATVAQLWFK